MRPDRRRSNPGGGGVNILDRIADEVDREVPA
jgi:hypothetical protein